MLVEHTSGNMLPLAQVDYDDLIAFPNPAGGWTYSLHGNGWPGPRYGYRIDTASNTVTFIFAHKVIIQAVYPSPATTRYQGRFRGRIYRLYNSICPVIQDYDEKTDWVDSVTSLDNASNEFIGFFISNGISENSLYNLTSTGSIEGRSYGSGHWVNHQAYATFNGNLYPTRLQPGTAYETRRDDQTDNLKVLKAMLMLYNATIFTDPLGRIVLKNKNVYSTNTIDIEDKDIVSFIIKRGNQEKPQIEEIDILAGDTTQLQGIIKNRLIDFYDSKWSIEAVIDQLSKYDLSLQSRIRIQDKVYAITELERDFNKVEYKVKAWLL
ncbi:MAG: hypothetical protein PHQ41_07510 [Candidatus Cloacimonetes bacterium]|nr:hypothetical protein [Candidatus Cloacimonadota bacterium]